MDGFDVGGDWADLDHLADIKEDRQRRMRSLIGKYVIVTKGKSSGRNTFLQDRRVSTGGYWTQFLSNAFGFDTIDRAEKVMSGFKYGNPRIAIVDKRGSYHFLTEEES